MITFRRSCAVIIFIPLFLVCLSVSAQERLRGLNTPTSIKAAGISTLGQWNANVVRYQLSMGAAVQTATPSEFLAWLSTELDTLDALLPTFAANGISVIIDLHSPPGGFETTQGFPLLKIFADTQSRQALFDAWDAIANRYVGNTTIFAYELVSEPGTGVKGSNPAWPQLAAELINAVLAVDANRTFIVAPDYAHFNKLKKFARALQSVLGSAVYTQHVMHSVHIFFPTKYVKQGLEGKKIGQKYPSKKVNKKFLKKKLKRIQRAQKQLKLKRLLIGEFSVVRWAAGADKYLRHLLSLFERFKWDYTYHIFREHHSWDLERTEDPDSTAQSTGETKRLTVVKQFLARNN